METAALVTAARHGDEDAYRLLVGLLRGELHAYCYRLLGSVRQRLATNACLDVIARGPKCVLPIDYQPLEEQAWVEP